MSGTISKTGRVRALRHNEVMQIDTATRSFVHEGRSYQYELRHRQTLNIGTEYDLVITDEHGRLVASKNGAYLTKDTPVESEHGLAGLLKRTLESPTPVLEDVKARPVKLQVLEGGKGKDQSLGL
jgi:hypothetical protein